MYFVLFLYCKSHGADTRYNMSPKLSNAPSAHKSEMKSMGFHHSQKSQFTDDSLLPPHLNPQYHPHSNNQQQILNQHPHHHQKPNFNGNLDAANKPPNSVKPKKSSSSGSSASGSSQKTLQGENPNLKSQQHAMNNNNNNSNSMKQHMSAGAAPSPSHTNNDGSKMASHSPALSGFSPASIPSRPSSINMQQQMSSPLPHANSQQQALEQQQQQFLMAQQAALLFRNPQMLNEQNSQNLKQQYQNMLSQNSQNSASSGGNKQPFFANEMSPAPNNLRTGSQQQPQHPHHHQQQQQQQQAPPHIQPPNLFMSPQQMAAQNEEINRLGLLERERQIRMFTQMMAAPGLNEDMYRYYDTRMCDNYTLT